MSQVYHTTWEWEHPWNNFIITTINRITAPTLQVRNSQLITRLPQAAAPQPPQIIPSETASTSSLVDVDTPSVRTVPSDFLEQDIQTETQERRRDMEEAAAHAAARARAEADLAKKKSAKKARKADNAVTKFFADLSEGASTALVVTNLTAVVGVSAYLGYKALGLYEHGRLTWKNIGIGAGVALGVGILEAALGGYLYKGKKKSEQS